MKRELDRLRDGNAKVLETGDIEGRICKVREKTKNHSTQDSCMVPHPGTNWAALRLTTQIRRDAVLSESYGRG